MSTHELRDPRAALSRVGDADVLADGKLAVLDVMGGKVALFDGEGSFVKGLELPIGIDPRTVLFRRLVSLPDGGLVIAEDRSHQFLFYDNRLKPRSVVPFGIETFNLGGFVRHPSGDLYVVAFCQDKGKILHRFDSTGHYVSSSVDVVDFPAHADVFNTGSVTVDPADGTLWLSRLVPYEILHVTQQGTILNRISRDLPGFSPAVDSSRRGLITFSEDFSRSVSIAVFGDLVINSYVQASGERHADAFRRDGVFVQELSSTEPMTFSKHLDSGLALRFLDDPRPHVGVWKESK